MAAALAILACAGAAHARTRLYAVVIAQNRSLDPGVKPLQYADDDGVKNYELLSLYADRASLFVVLDDETARLHPDAAKEAEVPERAAILDRLEQYNVLMAADIRHGDQPELFFVYAGHGDVDATGQGYVNLHDSKLTRADLYREVIAPSKARFVHVIVDACKSYFMVNSRGGKRWVDDRVDPSVDRSDAQVKAFLAEEQLERYPRAGVIVATSGDQETHEWSRYQGGILSHELRSALSGAADVNGDGRIEYSELRAFLAAANARVKNPEARVEVFSRPPALDRHRALIDLRSANGDGRSARFLHFAPELAGRFHIEDDRGVRYADLNKEAGAAFDVAISSRRDYYVRRAQGRDLADEDEEVEVHAPGPRRVEIAQLSWRARAIASRGALDQTFRQDLYRVPFGRGFYDGFVATSGDLAVEEGEPFVVKESREAGVHRITAGYVLSGSPAGDAGVSNGVDLRYGYRFSRYFDVGPVLQVAHGETTMQQATRFALMADLGFEWDPRTWLALRFDAAFGWQMVSGTLNLAGTVVNGAEGRGLRLEAGPGVGFNVWKSLWVLGRGGVAVDGLYSQAAPASTQVTGFFNLAVQLRL
ncbi:MAG TPA: hypothetical protein VFF06_22545 [Polyangia bacterium]|nr:hypothetical protein [Polyangia bacterium]